VGAQHERSSRDSSSASRCASESLFTLAWEPTFVLTSLEPIDKSGNLEETGKIKKDERKGDAAVAYPLAPQIDNSFIDRKTSST